MKKVAIIGAGFTGLTAAHELAKQGISVTVFEKGSDIGGLAGGFTIEGASLEKAYHHLFRTDTDILSLIEELGLQHELGWFESKIGMVVKEKGTFQIYPFNGVLDLLSYKPLPFFDRIRAGAVLFFLQKYTNWKNLVKYTAQDWMTKWSGQKVMDKIWGPLLRGKFSEFLANVSMAWLWARIHIRANSRKSIFERELLAYPTKGFHSIAERLGEKIAQLQNQSRDKVIKLNVVIEKVSYENEKPVVSYDGNTEVFDALLSTIPQKAFVSLISETSKINDTSETTTIDYLGAVLLVFTSNQSLSRYYWHNIIDEHSPFLVFLQHTNLVPKSLYNEQNVYYIGVYVPMNHKYFSDEKYQKNGIQEEWFAYLKTVFTEFDETQVSNLNLFKFPYAQHVVDVTYPEKIPAYRSIYPNTYISNFAQIFPEDRGTNYAVREGRKIASLLSDHLLQ
ncbi:FAD-dependent oxidoreductase [bacterium]|nr:FAD-dependent oxidoreductase [bacterium]